MSGIMVKPTNRPRVAVTTGDMTPKDVTSMPHDLTHEHYWAAGFIEGEGCFTTSQGYFRVVAGQKYREPLERLEAILGGRIYKQTYREFFTWQIGSKAEAEALIEWLYPLLSSRRQTQIDEALAKRDAYHAGSDEKKKENARRAAYNRMKYRTDPEWKEKRLAEQRKWAKENRDYPEQYRRKKAKAERG